MEDWKIKGSVVRTIGILIILSLIVSQVWSIYEIKRLRNDLNTAQVISSVVAKVNDHDGKIVQIIDVLVKAGAITTQPQNPGRQEELKK